MTSAASSTSASIPTSAAIPPWSRSIPPPPASRLDSRLLVVVGPPGFCFGRSGPWSSPLLLLRAQFNLRQVFPGRVPRAKTNGRTFRQGREPMKRRVLVPISTIMAPNWRSLLFPRGTRTRFAIFPASQESQVYPVSRSRRRRRREGKAESERARRPTTTEGRRVRASVSVCSGKGNGGKGAERERAAGFGPGGRREEETPRGQKSSVFGAARGTQGRLWCARAPWPWIQEGVCPRPQG